MDFYELIKYAFIDLLNWKVMSYMFSGSFLGLLVGAMPGMTSAIAVTLLLPLTFYMGKLNSLVFLTAIYISAISGGAITAIYFNIPGTPESSITCIDGHAMTKKGMQSEAVGVAFGASFMGGMLSYIVLLLFLGKLSTIALKFGPIETFLTAIMGIIAVSFIRSKSVIKGLIASVFGLMIGLIGMSPTGEFRALYGTLYFMDGIPMLTALIGMLAMSEILIMVEKEGVTKATKEVYKQKDVKIRKILSGIIYSWKSYIDVIIASIIGIIVGMIPGTGATMSAFLAYIRAKQFTKKGKEIGTGVPEGIIAPETANNSSTGGALLTTLTLGIPGSATCAVLLGALTLQGLTPGPLLVYQQPRLIYSVVVSLFLSNIPTLFFAILLAFYGGLLLKLSNKILAPIISIFCIIGSFSIRMSYFDVYLMLGFGILGWLMHKYEYPAICTVMGIILSTIADGNLTRAIQAYGKNFFYVLFSSTTSIIILVIIAILSLCSIFLKKLVPREEQIHKQS